MYNLHVGQRLVVEGETIISLVLINHYWFKDIQLVFGLFRVASLLIPTAGGISWQSVSSLPIIELNVELASFLFRHGGATVHCK